MSHRKTQAFCRMSSKTHVSEDHSQSIFSHATHLEKVSTKLAIYLGYVFLKLSLGVRSPIMTILIILIYSDQLWKLEGDKLKNKNGDLALSDVKIPDEGDQGHIKGQTPQDQTLKGQNDKIIGLVDEKIKLEDTNSQTEKEYDWKYDWKIKKEDEEFFTLESVSEPKQFLTWNSDDDEFVIASMYYLLLS